MGFLYNTGIERDPPSHTFGSKQLFDLTQLGGPVGLSEPHTIGVFPDSLESLGLRCCVVCVVWRCGGVVVCGVVRWGSQSSELLTIKIWTSFYLLLEFGTI